jgi:16S rRNA (cytidine1402-2'-O)-methyltransferase
VQEGSTKTSLYLVPTPIGNLEDITLRAIRILKEVDSVLAEDTRVTGSLFKLLGIDKRAFSYHLNNEHKVVENIVSRLKKGEIMALVSDAGTPAISDPGFLLVRAALKEGLKVECLPGPTAFVPALVKSGFPTDKFVFEGFLPLKKGRQTRLKLLAEEERTIVLYESPHRLLKFLEELNTYFGADREISVSRELTKKFEETVNGTVTELIEYYKNNTLKGEFVIVIKAKE